MDETMAHGWATITKAERQPDGSVMVTGLMSDNGRDRDGQGMNQTWLDKAAQTWFDESGNIREQHDRFKAAGVGVNLVRKTDGGWVLQSRIVDPVAGAKCLPGPNGERPVYQGYSIGVREPRLSFEKSEFPGGEVVGGYICEVSLADRPSNPRTMFTMVKSDGPDQEPYPVGEETEPEFDPATETATGEDITKAVKPGQRFRHGWIPIGEGAGSGAPQIGDHAHSMRVGDVAAAHHEGKTIIGHITGFSGSNGTHVNIKHEGGEVSVPRESVSHLHVAEPPKAQDQGMGTIKGNPEPDAGLRSLSPEGHQAAKLREQHAETEALGRSALGEGMFAAAIRQAEAAAARRAAAPAPAAKSPSTGSKVKGAVKGAAHWMSDELAGAHDVRKAEVPDLFKFVSAKQRAKYADQGIAMPNGDFPIKDHAHLTAALRLLSRYKGDQAAAKAHIKKRAAALGMDVDLDGDGAAEKLAAIAELTKAAGWIMEDMLAAGVAQTDHDDVTLEGSILKTDELMTMITAAVTDAVKGSEERTGEKIAALAGRLEKVEAAPVPGGPAISRAPGQTQQAKNREVAAVQEKIADLDRLADLTKTEDATLSKGYREMADDLRAQITRS